MEDFLLETFQENLMRTLQENDPFSDVTIHLGRKGSGTSVLNCHKHMLAAQSPVFARLLNQAGQPSSMQGKGLMKASLRVECDPEAFGDVITFLYSGRARVRPEYAMELLGVSLRYEIEALVRLYSAFFDACLSVTTVCPLLASALQFGLPATIVERCESFLLRNASASLSQPTMECLPEDELLRLLDDDDLQMHEIEAFLAVLRWGRARYGEGYGQAGLREKLDPLMRSIRFPQIEGKDMADTIEPTNMVDPGLLLEAYRFR
eukprot:CAMPEP_0113709734 /NCGR_PEP_ID=MMETSP0038_2-20120614/29744_1 /TAXON_ID=2898 /ORGANISM="Cryptomonas paramecium" /LENGTH=262 /DNA_ID=CAMNT_0000635669 /DNA_START=12 /DNA_END=797 /DNA_ORIENTATION=+ /assembly_acc=CAM_ASM_000170